MTGAARPFDWHLHLLWLLIFPASAMFLLLICLNVIADKLRAYFDVSEIKL